MGLPILVWEYRPAHFESRRFGIVLPLASAVEGQGEWSPQFETQISSAAGPLPHPWMIDACFVAANDSTGATLPLALRSKMRIELSPLFATMMAS